MSSHNVMFHILGKNPPQTARLGRSNATNFGTCEKRIDSTNEYIEVALILGNIPTTVRIGIGGLEAHGKPLRQHMCDMLEKPRRRLGGEKSYKRIERVSENQYRVE